jgi:hypothetical protein
MHVIEYVHDYSTRPARDSCGHSVARATEWHGTRTQCTHAHTHAHTHIHTHTHTHSATHSSSQESTRHALMETHTVCHISYPYVHCQRVRMCLSLTSARRTSTRAATRSLRICCSAPCAAASCARSASVPSGGDDARSRNCRPLWGAFRRIELIGPRRTNGSMAINVG